MIMFRKFWGSWPQHFVRLDSGEVVYVRIRYGQVWIGVGDTEESAMDNSVLTKGSEIYQGVTDAVDALFELRENGYHFVPPVNLEAK
jgi:hypothetical protein